MTLQEKQQIEQRLNDQGRKLQWLASYLGVSRPTLWRRIHTDKEFSQEEISKLKELKLIE